MLPLHSGSNNSCSCNSGTAINLFFVKAQGSSLPVACHSGKQEWGEWEVELVYAQLS